MDRTEEKPDDSTLALWDSRTSREMTAEDAREIRENVTGFFRVLQEWKARDLNRRRERASSGSSASDAASECLTDKTLDEP